MINKGQFKKGHNQNKTYEEIYGKEQAKEIKSSISLSKLGKKHSEEHSNNIKKSLIKINTITRFKKGQTPWNKGLKIKHPFKEQSKILIKTKKGRKAWNKGLKGAQVAWNKGLTKETDERVLKYSISQIGKTGELSTNWLGGKSFEPYTKDFNKRFKKAIKQRDGCCMLCNIGFDDLRLLKRYIHIHHIDYNKLNSFPQNCISLCTSCHTKTNFNRTQWIIFFQSLLKERYNYKYTEDQKILLNFKEEVKI